MNTALSSASTNDQIQPSGKLSFSAGGESQSCPLPIVNKHCSPPCCQIATTKHKQLVEKFQWDVKNRKLGAGCGDYSICRWWRGFNDAFPRVTILTQLLFCLVLTAYPKSAPAQATQQQIQVDFEDGQKEFQAGSKMLAEQIAVHENTDIDSHAGKRCERLIFQSQQYLENQTFDYAVPPSRVFDELLASVWIRSNCPEIRLAMRIQFPHQIDPRTGERMTLELMGERYSKFTEWQQIRCHASDVNVGNRLNLARAQLSSQGNPIEFDTREAFVDQISLVVTVQKGESALQIDQLEVGPVISPSKLVVGDLDDKPVRTRLKIVDDRIYKDDRPFFPVFTLYHGESLNEIQSTGVNTLWIPDYADKALLKALAGIDIGAFAQPPQLTPEEAVLNKKGLPAFPSWTEPIWAWMFGFEIPEDDVRYIDGWANQVRISDQRMRRPILADVKGNERSFHRKVDLLGSSQFVMHSSVSMPRHAQKLKHRRNLALPGKPMFTFVQTEASTPLLDYKAHSDSLPVVEPEQILHQGYAAIAAGFKGVGFWKQIPLDADIPGLNERVHAIRLFALHCQVLQPWLATGRVMDDLPVRLDSGTDPAEAGVFAPLRSRWDMPIEQVTSQLAARNTEILATVIRSDDGILILPVWYEENEQCVPGPQAATSIRMLIKGDIWQAWEVTPVGVTQSNLEVSWPAGGTEILLKEFDQQSAIIISDNAAVIEKLQRDCRRIRDESARAMVSLAQLKFDRVQKVHQKLEDLNASLPEAELLLRQAYSYLESSQKELNSSRPVEAYSAAQKALQYLRSLQRRYWEAANVELPSVTTSLDATGFQTLPDHWALLSELGTRTSTSPNLIPTGDFEDAEAMFGLWTNGSTEKGNKKILRERDELRNDYHLALRLESNPGDNAAIVLTSPEIEAYAGDLIVVTAQVRSRGPFRSANDGFLVFDTLVGRQGAVRLSRKNTNWQTIKIVRRIDEDAHFRIRFELEGSGAVDIDDLRVHRLLP